MPTTNFPEGVSSFGVPVLPAIGGLFTTGKVFFVDSNLGNNGRNGRSPEQALATIANALARCTANKGDIIVAMPGHTETISAAGTLTAVAGVTVIGLGSGTLKPLLTWSATGSTFAISAANFRLINVNTQVSVDSVVVMFPVTAAGFVMDSVDFIETSAKQALIFLNTTAAGVQPTIRNCKHRQITAGCTKWIDLVGADRFVIENCFFHLHASTHIIGGTTTESLQGLLQNINSVNEADAANILMLANTTGFANNCRSGGAKSAVAAMNAFASMYAAECYSSNDANKNGLLDPTVSS
ncbi:hypothetical protein KW797_00065 [Candidatus Parcubacteria bacterium]|nr:hypothetical protein [Candidatus Parcubacteria bacterium]